MDEPDEALRSAVPGKYKPASAPPAPAPARTTGTFADSIEQLPDLKPVRPTGVALGPAPGLGEVFGANLDLARDDNVDAEQRRTAEGWAPIVSALGLGDTQNPAAFYENLSTRNPILVRSELLARQGRAEVMTNRAMQKQLLADEIRAHRARDPKFLPGVPDTVAGIESWILERKKEQRAASKATADRAEGFGGTVAGLAGSLVGSIDSGTIATLPLGGGGKTLIQVAGREALVNGLLETLLVPVVADNRADLGEELTVGEAVANIGLAAAGGGILGGGFHLAGKALSPVAQRALDKVNQVRAARQLAGVELDPVDLFAELDNRELAALTREAIGADKLTPDERAAIATLERDQEIGEASPFVSNPAGTAQHEARLSDAINDLLENRRPREFPVAPDAGAGARATGPERPPAGTSIPARRPQGSPATGQPHARLGDFASELERRGIPAPIARGAAAGLIAESGGKLDARGPVTEATRGDRALGYGQWLFERQAELIKRYGPNPSHSQQLDYLAWELKGGDHGGKSVLSAKDEVDALNRYIRDFMRPGKGRETDGDIERGMAALGLAGDRPAPAAREASIGATDPAIALLRKEALDLDDQIVGLTRLADGTAINLFTRNVPASAIGVDATRFQFKSGGDEFGVTDRLKGIKDYDAGLAGRVTLWEDEAGKLWLADGHQRHGLARRIGAEQGADIGMDAMVLRAADGITAEDARVWAALKNIAEGTGSAVDAAKVLRDAGGAALDRLPPKSPLVRDGAALARLSDDAFGAVYNERLPADQAAVIGHLLPDNPETHIGMVDLLIKTDPANRAQAQSIVRQAIAAGFHTEEQLDLLGSSVSVASLFAEKAKILERGLARLRKMRLVHKTAANEADELERKGSTIARAQSEKEAQANAEAISIVDRLAYRAGPVADALTDAARELAGGARLGDAADRFTARIRYLDLRALNAGDDGRGADFDGAGRESDPGQADAPLFEEPGDRGQPSLIELAAATERFSDPDGPAVKQQADSLEHDFRAAGELIEDQRNGGLTRKPLPEELAGDATAIFGEWLGDWGHPAPTGKAARAAEASDAVQEAIEKAADNLAMKAKREISIEPTDETELEVETIEAIAKAVLAGEDPDKAVAAAIKDGRLTVSDDGPPAPAAPPEPMPPSSTVPPPANPKKSADYAGAFVDQATAKAKLEEWKAEALRIGRESPPPPGTLILSLFDSSGRFSQPYRDMGYEVIQLDKNLGVDVIEDISLIQHAIDEVKARGGRFAGVLAQPPCTTFAGSGARWWDERHNRNWYNAVRKMWGARAAKLFDSPVEYNQFLVAVTQEYIGRAKPDFFVIENPRGRIAEMTGLPKPNLVIEPHHFGDAYTKNTNLWGKFNNELETVNVSPKEEDGGEGSKMHKLRGRDEKDDGLRSITPEGFAYAFALANRPGTEARAIDGDLPAAANDAPALDRGAELDPGKVERDRQLVGLGAAAPLRASNDVDQLGEIGLELFDQANQGKLDLGALNDFQAREVEKALAELPEGWRIEVKPGSVDLTPPSGKQRSYVRDGDRPGLARLIKGAVHEAKLAEQEIAGGLSFRLDEEGDEISAEDLLAEIEADAKAIETLRGCL